MKNKKQQKKKNRYVPYHLWFNNNVMELVNVVIFYLVFIYDATNESSQERFN